MTDEDLRWCDVCDDCSHYKAVGDEKYQCTLEGGRCRGYFAYKKLKAENAALRKRLEKAATFALDMCSEDDCAGDGSVGLPPCDMWHAWDTNGNGVNIESGCYLKEYLTELKGG